ncbi:MAG TPA: hypothetical protein VMW05_10335 [Methyloceanibacter sp.]|nr:hypothetical protein [Methyloceanibacter sp.]
MARAPLTFRQSDLERAIKGAKATGLEISRVEIDKDGKIVVIIGISDAPHDTKEIVL